MAKKNTFQGQRGGLVVKDTAIFPGDPHSIPGSCDY